MSISGLSGLSGLSGIVAPPGGGGGPTAPTLNTTNLFWHSRANTSVTHVANAVTSWDKIAGSASITLDNASATKPVLVPSDSNAGNKTTIQCGQNDQTLYANCVGTINSAAGAIIMAAYLPQTNDAGVVCGFRRPGSSVRVEFESNSSNKLGIDVFDGSNFASNFDSTNSYTANTLAIFTFAYDGSTFRIRKDNTEIHTWANAHYLDTVESGGGGIIWQLGGGGFPAIGEECQFYIAELAFYTDYNLTKIQAAEQAMIDFYGVA